MPGNVESRRLDASDADLVEECYDSQPRLMLAEKRPGATRYAIVFRGLLASGCIAYGAFRDGVLVAFCVLWPWPGLPVATMVIFLSRPTGSIYNPERSGLRYAIDAALAHVEALGVWSIYYVRADSERWRRSRVTRGLGRHGEYRLVPVERIARGSLSRYPDINRLVLGGMPVPGDAVIVQGLRPYDDDF
jgi:hypothetical protein